MILDFSITRIAVASFPHLSALKNLEKEASFVSPQVFPSLTAFCPLGSPKLPKPFQPKAFSWHFHPVGARPLRCTNQIARTMLTPSIRRDIVYSIVFTRETRPCSPSDFQNLPRSVQHVALFVCKSLPKKEQGCTCFFGRADLFSVEEFCGLYHAKGSLWPEEIAEDPKTSGCESPPCQVFVFEDPCRMPFEGGMQESFKVFL